LLVAVVWIAAPATAVARHHPTPVRYVIVRHSKGCRVTINARSGKRRFRADKGHYGRFTAVVKHGKKVIVYTNESRSGVSPWGMTQAESAGFERWLACDIHANGLAALQKNDPANQPADEPLFDGMIIEECNYYNDPCSGPGGDASAYLAGGKPVLNAEYTSDGETTAKFCSVDEAAGITRALFDVSLDGTTYQPCKP
jgi:hypothetical protein